MLHFNSNDTTMAFDLFLLLLIGIGPKIALVPFLEMTAEMDRATKRRVVRKMITTATVVAVILIAFGGVLTNLLHFSTGALSIAGGVILLVIAHRCVDGPQSRGFRGLGAPQSTTLTRCAWRSSRWRCHIS